jgi:hypothetical protein
MLFPVITYFYFTRNFMFCFGVASVKPEILKNLGQAITTLPDGFTAHKGIQRVYDARKKMIETGEGVDWATAEALAFATLLVEGNICHLFIFFQCSMLCRLLLLLL